MPRPEPVTDTAANAVALEAFADVSDAVESGAGLPEVARTVSRALNASVAVVDSSANVLAVACASPDDERVVLSSGEVMELRLADVAVGQLRYRARGEPPAPALLRLLGTLVAQEVERSKAPRRASQAAASVFVADVFERRATDRENIVARGKELGTDLSGGASVVVLRALPLQPAEGDWRARVLAVAERGLRTVTRSYLAAALEVGRWGRGQNGGHEAELVLVIPGGDGELIARAVHAMHRELDASMPGFTVAVASSRPAADPVDLHRAGAEAFLAANVAVAQGVSELAFEDTGAYRLLLPAMVEDPEELRRFHDETVAPLVAYDEQYDTELVRTLESFLDADGNVAQTAQRLYTHRHTIRYRLERVKELTGLDVASTDGRERLGLGLKAMRVLGILAPHGPASEPGAEGGRVPREEKDR